MALHTTRALGGWHYRQIMLHENACFNVKAVAAPIARAPANTAPCKNEEFCSGCSVCADGEDWVSVLSLLILAG